MAYTPKAAAEIQAQATAEYQSYYDQLVLAARQQAQQQDQLYQQQKSGLAKTYDVQRDSSKKEYTSAYSQAGRESLSRGMQRSTFNNQTLSNINTKASEAQQAIADAQAAAEADVEADRSTLASQLSAQIMQYNASQASDIQKRIAEINTEEYQKSQDEIANQLARDQLNEQIREFNVAQAAKSKSRSGSGKGSSKKTVTTPSGSSGYLPSTSSLSSLISMLSGGSKGSAGSGSKGKTGSGSSESIFGRVPGYTR